LALQQSATWTLAFAVVFIAQQQVFAAASEAEPVVPLFLAAAQQALPSAQHFWPFAQQPAFVAA